MTDYEDMEKTFSSVLSNYYFIMLVENDMVEKYLAGNQQTTVPVLLLTFRIYSLHRTRFLHSPADPGQS